jgi:hypothetical protein
VYILTKDSTVIDTANVIGYSIKTLGYSTRLDYAIEAQTNTVYKTKIDKSSHSETHTHEFRTVTICRSAEREVLEAMMVDIVTSIGSREVYNVNERSNLILI